MAIVTPTPLFTQAAREPKLGRQRAWPKVRQALRIAQVRLRLLFVLLAAFVVVGKWDTWRNYWDRFTRDLSGSEPRQSISPDTEYFCPMCPGVLSDWPTKCPVCNMSLVRHKKGEMVSLPDGVIARMQFSPERVQLAGIQTSPIEYRPLFHEIATGGLVGAVEARSLSAPVVASINWTDLSLLKEGQYFEGQCDLFAEHLPFRGRLREVPAFPTGSARAARIVLDFENPSQDLRPGMFVSVCAHVPATRLRPVARARLESWQTTVLSRVAAQAMAGPLWPAVENVSTNLFEDAGLNAMDMAGLTPAIPTSAVIATGQRRVVYVEGSPGLFDGVEVRLGPRCGGYYPVLSGVRAGQRVASAGAFLIDAETGINPSIAASYFGSGRGSKPKPADPGSDRLSSLLPAQAEAIRRLAPEDQARALQQSVCPVTGEPLGSMGTPVRLNVGNRIVFLCCGGCKKAVEKDPDKYLGTKLP